MYGFSIGISDVTPTEQLCASKQRLLDAGYSKCDEYLKAYKNGTLKVQPGCDLLSTLESKMNICLSQIREDAGKECIAKLPYFSNAPLIMAECGSKGSKINIAQMIACVGQQTVNGSRVIEHFINRTLPHFAINERSARAKGFVPNSFFSGITATEFFFHTMGGREGLVDTAVKTAETGYMQRRLMKNFEDVSIQYDYTVRNSNKQIIQFLFGNDGIDPMNVENETVVNFKAILTNIRRSRNIRKQIRDKIDKSESVDDKSDMDVDSDMDVMNIGDELFDDINVEDVDDNILMPEIIETFSKTYVYEYVPNEMHFIRRNINYSTELCKYRFENDIIQFLKENVIKPGKDYFSMQSEQSFESIEYWYRELYGLTKYELKKFVRISTETYLKCFMEPGSAAGGVSATSLGEPATQMTLKTFHFAGVASMNITQGIFCKYLY